jgi:hypothetical protein
VAVTEDASTPAVATSAGGSTSTTLASASFSPPAGSVLVADCLINYGTYPGAVPTISVSDSASGTWAIGAAQLGNPAAFAVIAQFTRPVPTAPGSITVTMHRGTDSSAAMLMLAVRVLDGANVSSPQGASNTATSDTTNAEVTVTPAQAGSYLAVAAINTDNTTNTALSGTTIIQQANDTVDLGTLAVGKYGPVASLTSTTVGWTLGATKHAAAAVLEIVPPAPPPASHGLLMVMGM